MHVIPTYTREAPGQAGYYWMREGGLEQIVEVWNDPGDSSEEAVFYLHSCGSGDISELTASIDAEWAGPILPPGEAENS